MLVKIWKVIWHSWETLYRCNRVREAWWYWTMTQDDFEEVEPVVMIWDVLDWIDKGDFENMYDQIYTQDRIRIDDPDEDNITSIVNILYLRKEKRKPIDEQDEECIKFVYYLLPTK